MGLTQLTADRVLAAGTPRRPGVGVDHDARRRSAGIEHGRAGRADRTGTRPAVRGARETDIADRLAASPDLFPLLLDLAGDRVAVVRLSEALYGSLSFLDERILAEVGPPTWVAGSEIDRAARALTGECDFIFHIGHVGSTLLSRLLAVSGRVLPVREPAILRTLATLAADLSPSPGPADDRDFSRRLDIFPRLWSRAYRPGQRALIKATSYVSVIAPQLMTRAPSAKAILMFTPPQTYMATILGGPNSPQELRAFAPARLPRLERRLGVAAWRLESMTAGERAAMSWACEIRALADIAERFADRVAWLDFDDFLARPAAGLAAALTRLQGEAPAREVAAMLESPDFTRYSKAPDQAYDAEARRQILARARLEHAIELARGFAWLNAATAFPAIAAAVTAAARAPRIG